MYTGSVNITGNCSSVNSSPTSIPTPIPTPNPADIDKNGQINAVDLILVLKNWLGVSICSTFICDLNHDSKINVLDASIIIGNFGK